ncbi:MAG: D-glycerate dehydrogenase [Nitrososphaerota archaeon]|nr:D-glycerate dehydrogenase [Candidatus Bathyarchaeota archaeon]MDW8048504.1 D-glycerate dehydrogenase [Nitrososphaerota archaeon]
MKNRFKVFVTARIHEDGLKLLERQAEVVFPDKSADSLTVEDFIRFGQNSDGMIVVTNVEKITREVIEGIPSLKIIARYGVGYDNVDVKAASERGVYVTITPVLDETVADHAFALLLSLARNVCKGHNYVMSKGWTARTPSIFMGTDVWGKTAGIIGLGRIGTRIAERAIGFKMRILYYDTVRKSDIEDKLLAEYRSLDALLAESDIIFISCPLTDETRNLLDEEELSRMKKSAFLINVARGPIVNHGALVKALREGWIAGAGLDVFNREPLPADDPLLELDNVVLTPHLASSTWECRRRMAITAAEEVLRVLDGNPPRYAVNPEISVRRS